MDDNTQIAVREETAPAQASEAGSIMAVIERAALNPDVDIEKMERLFALHEKAVNRNAREAFYSDFAAMQPELPIIEERGQIKVGAEIRSTYAKWEDINEQIKPILFKFGFGLSFRVKREADQVVVTGVLSHRLGHYEETTLPVPLDTSGSKNNVQAVGSSTSYGKRYTASALLNLTSRHEDDDGVKGGRRETITTEQAELARARLEKTKSNIPVFCAIFKVERLEDIPAKEHERMMKLIAAKEEKSNA